MENFQALNFDDVTDDGDTSQHESYTQHFQEAREPRFAQFLRHEERRREFVKQAELAMNSRRLMSWL